MIYPIYVTYDGNVFTPMARYKHRCDQQFATDNVTTYRLVIEEERSEKSHRQYFATVRDAYLSLPENLGERFINADHLRKWCLIKTGWALVQEQELDTPHDAEIVTGFIRRREPYSVVVRRGCVVVVYTAMSQSKNAMKKEPFEKSKHDVLDLIDSMLGVPLGTTFAQQNYPHTGRSDEAPSPPPPDGDG